MHPMKNQSEFRVLSTPELRRRQFHGQTFSVLAGRTGGVPKPSYNTGLLNFAEYAHVPHAEFSRSDEIQPKAFAVAGSPSDYRRRASFEMTNTAECPWRQN
jgi:hypothetical protein